MNHTEHGNIAVGSPGSQARAEANEAFLAAKLKLMERAADELRDYFVPNDEQHPAIVAYNNAKEFRGDGPHDLARVNKQVNDAAILSEQ